MSKKRKAGDVEPVDTAAPAGENCDTADLAGDLTPIQKARAARGAGPRRPQHPIWYQVVAEERSTGRPQVVYMSKSRRGAIRWMSDNGLVIAAGFDEPAVFRMRQVWPEARTTDATPG